MRRKPWVAAVGFALLAGAALLFTNPDALTGAAGGAGCSAEDFADSELAKQESQYLVMEVMVVLALGLEQGSDYLGVIEGFTGDLRTVSDPVAVSHSNEQNCYQTVVSDSNLLGAHLNVDFGQCTDRNGKVDVAVAAQYPEGVDLAALGGNGPADFDPNNPGTPPPGGLPEDISPTAMSYDLTMYDARRSGVLLEGLLGYTQPADAGAEQGLRTDLSFDFLDFAGTLTMEGTLRQDGDTSTVDFTGTFKSVGGLDWPVEATGLEVNADCKGLRAGKLVARYSNPAIEQVEVVATFDGSCDGCAHVTLDGREVSDVCIPEALGL